jgi:hypothetical protein
VSGEADGMKIPPTSTSSYPRHRFPAEIISHAVWLYHDALLDDLRKCVRLECLGLHPSASEHRSKYRAACDAGRR